VLLLAVASERESSEKQTMNTLEFVLPRAQRFLMHFIAFYSITEMSKARHSAHDREACACPSPRAAIAGHGVHALVHGRRKLITTSYLHGHHRLALVHMQVLKIDMLYIGLLTTVLLLILVYILYIYNSDSGAQLSELLTPQSLGKNVRQLLRGPNGPELYPAFLDTLAYEVVANVDMLAAIVKDRVLTESDGRLVVDVEGEGTSLLASEFSK
jgi:hypothetical protein